VTDTIAVPVELIENLKIMYPGTSGFEGSALNKITSLLPKPVKVGDELTLEQIEALPARSVITDKDGDVYVTGSGEAKRVTDYAAPDVVRTRGSLFSDSYAPFILQYIGKSNPVGPDSDSW
jgi:hypothetical protein